MKCWQYSKIEFLEESVDWARNKFSVKMLMVVKMFGPMFYALYVLT